MNKFFETSIVSVEKRLKELTDSFACEKVLKESMGYSLLAGGKRIRPLLLLTSAKIIGLDQSDVLNMACALEMIHTYSLIHDDLPAMDDDDLRRGKPTNHKVFGEAMAILAGDALLNESHRILIKEFGGTPNGRNAILEISELAGKDGMINGQVIDIVSEGKSLDINTLEKLHRNKTGALIKASLTAPFLLAGKSDSEIKVIREIGDKIGILFQIQDDILDAVSDADTLGKTPGKDLRDNKNTYVTLLGLEESRVLIKRIYEETKEKISHIDNGEGLLQNLLDMILVRTK